MQSPLSHAPSSPLQPLFHIFSKKALSLRKILEILHHSSQFRSFFSIFSHILSLLGKILENHIQIPVFSRFFQYCSKISCKMRNLLEILRLLFMRNKQQQKNCLRFQRQL